MIDDPIVIRKSRGLLVVSSSNPTDPIQLVRELSHDKLEVHLKNGSKYIEELQEGDDIQEIILEMMGYSNLEAVLTFHAWPASQKGELAFYEEPEDMQRIGEQIVNYIFNQTPYMNTKFLSMELDDVVEKANIKYDDGTYSHYDVTYRIRFRARVDAAEEIAREFSDNPIEIAHWTIANKSRHYDCAGINRCNVAVLNYTIPCYNRT